MKIFVTGASGLIGQAVVRMLAGQDHWVVALTRSPGHARHLQSLGAEPLQGDLTHHRRFSDALRDCRAVIHLAGSAPDEGDEAGCHRLDVDGTRNLLEALPHRSIERFVHASSAAVLGQQGGDWVGEAVEPGALTPHGASKREAETLLTNAHRIFKLPAVMLRFGLVYGPGSFFGRMLDHLRAGDLAPPRRVLEAHWGLVSAHDAARACLHMLHRGRPGEAYFVADDHPQTAAEVLTVAARQLHLKGLPRPGLLSRWRMSASMTAAMGLSLRPRNDKLKRETGFAFEHPSLPAGLPAMLREEVPVG